MERYAVRSILFSAVLGLAGCHSPTAPETNLPITRVLQGDFSAGDSPQPERVVARSPAELAAAWNAMFLTRDPQPPIPTVDFTKEMVVIARTGAKPSGGYCINVDSAVGSSRKATVTVRTGGPTPSFLPAVTRPFDIVRIPRADEVTFAETSFIGNCGPLT